MKKSRKGGSKKAKKASKPVQVRYVKAWLPKVTKAELAVLEKVEELLWAVGGLLNEVPGLKVPRTDPVYKMVDAVRSARWFIEECKAGDLFERAVV